ncbi:2-C-methyl-D-erythritol 4-phosphate cytidylyltransferase [Thermobaculum terrenum ATCC BAA-798]|uniref:2-C-methyl-D-erythritol 4-phosphate cytidylyltransferase n=1 Tax=Thermobaculum terrenum (strain ATCC BAA-798 / CCMEE 7001 / YNP1) TaxID=525904 RepID=D1CCF1_THET1|nr:2-C-methyl-D-erythritol 4-phosphate cytidylyltransferase [Thermobaculum terrenum]ACZ42466.1 2-C-methyl-D-erythritol 4-phosphate cytidylyltransferase [Thermobaculum terrenum ATCC BAA-798]
MRNDSVVGAVIVAAGTSSRMSGIDKLWIDLGGKPVIYHSICAFQLLNDIDVIVVVTSATNQEKIRELCRRESLDKVVSVCLGGNTRQQSVLCGLREIPNASLVAIHDGARPLVTPEVIKRGIITAAEKGAAIAAVPAKSTYKVVDNQGKILSTPNRESLWEAQTPQVFNYMDILSAHERAAHQYEVFTDDASLMESMGRDVWVYEGDYRNIKITTFEDVLIARTLIDNRLAKG